jgi:hypothetical protein
MRLFSKFPDEEAERGSARRPNLQASASGELSAPRRRSPWLRSQRRDDLYDRSRERPVVPSVIDEINGSF